MPTQTQASARSWPRRPAPRSSPGVSGFLAVLLAALLAPSVLAQAPPKEEYEEEYRVKAAFLYNLAKFAQWPEAELDAEPRSFVLGILGKDPFEESIDKVVDGKTVDGVPIEVKRSRELGDLADCRILFISASEDRCIKRHLKALRGAPVVTVSDADGFARRGGMIELFLEDNRVLFSINLRAVKRSGLYISSKLLALAQIVEEDG